MTKEQIKKEIREVKHAMFIARPLKGYLGNQFEYWNKKLLELKSKVK